MARIPLSSNGDRIGMLLLVSRQGRAIRDPIVLATIAASHTDGLRADGETVAAALNGGYHLAYLVGAGLALVAALVAALTFPGRGVASDRDARSLDPRSAPAELQLPGHAA